MFRDYASFYGEEFTVSCQYQFTQLSKVDDINHFKTYLL